MDKCVLCQNINENLKLDICEDCYRLDHIEFDNRFKQYLRSKKIKKILNLK
jgi:hypothetical protein